VGKRARRLQIPGISQAQRQPQYASSSHQACSIPHFTHPPHHQSVRPPCAIPAPGHTPLPSQKSEPKSGELWQNGLVCALVRKRKPGDVLEKITSPYMGVHAGVVQAHATSTACSTTWSAFIGLQNHLQPGNWAPPPSFWLRRPGQQSRCGWPFCAY